MAEGYYYDSEEIIRKKDYNRVLCTFEASNKDWLL